VKPASVALTEEQNGDFAALYTTKIHFLTSAFVLLSHPPLPCATSD
jgi:hypothetical protein